MLGAMDVDLPQCCSEMNSREFLVPPVYNTPSVTKETLNLADHRDIQIGWEEG